MAGPQPDCWWHLTRPHGTQMSEMIQRDEALLNGTAWLEGRTTPDDLYNALKR